MGATETIARWVVNTNYEDIPPDAIRVANESCFDLLGVILAGSVQPVGQIIQKYVNDQGAVPEATVLSGGNQTTLANAALANGTMGHALDYDDFGGFGHPTVAIFPALLAIGEQAGATGRDLLEAYVIGCEVGLALQHTTKYKQMDKGFHKHRRHRAPGLRRRLRQAAQAGRGPDDNRAGHRRVHGLRPDPQLRHHDQAAARRPHRARRRHRRSGWPRPG